MDLYYAIRLLENALYQQVQDLIICYQEVKFAIKKVWASNIRREIFLFILGCPKMFNLEIFTVLI